MTTRIIKQKDKGTIRGRLRFKTFKAEKGFLLWFYNTLPSVYLAFRRKFPRTPIRVGKWNNNLIMLGTNTGLNLFIKRLLGTKLYDPEITQAKIGTGDTAPADADTDLETTVLAGILVSKSTEESAGVVTFEFFMSDADLTEGTYREFGIFCSSQLFARALILPVYSKSVGEDSQVEYTLTLTNS